MKPSRSVRVAHGVLLLVVALAFVAPLLRYARAPAAALVATDFRAFFCAARVFAAGDDPYRTAPLLACERRATGAGVADAVDPAPFPPYFFAVLAPLAHLPYGAANALWVAMIVAASLAAIPLVAALGGVPRRLVAPCVAVLGYATSVPFGELPPFVLACVAGTGVLLERGRPRAAAFVAAGAALEPHVALPLFVSLVAFVPRTRLVLAGACAALGLASLAHHGATLWAEYPAVLALHARSELPTKIQYSLAWLAWALGAPEATALRLGAAQYAATVGAALLAVRPLAQRFRSPALFAIFPVTATLVGGTFIHLGQLAIALPFAFFLVGRTEGRIRTGALAATAVLAAGGPPSPERIVLLASCAVIATCAIAAVRRERLRVAAASGAVLAYLALGAVCARLPAHPLRAVETAAAFRAANRAVPFVSELSGEVIRADAAFVEVSPRVLAAKLPVWIGIGGLYGLGLALAFGAVAPATKRHAPPRLRRGRDHGGLPTSTGTGADVIPSETSCPR